MKVDLTFADSKNILTISAIVNKPAEKKTSYLINDRRFME